MLSVIYEGKDFYVLPRKSRSKLLRQLCLQRTTRISYANLLDEQASLGLAQVKTKCKLDCFIKSKCTLVFVGANLCLIPGSGHSEVMNFHVIFKR